MAVSHPLFDKLFNAPELLRQGGKPKFGTVKQKPDSNLVGRWLFNEMAGATAHDISGKNNHCALTSGVTRVSDAQHIHALDFPGVSTSYGAISNPGAVLDGGYISCSAWIKVDDYDSSFPRIIDRVYNGQFSFYVNTTGPNLAVALNTVGTDVDENIGGCVISTDVWQHVGFSYDGETIRGYINGVLCGTNPTPSGVLANSTSDIRIGQRVDGTLNREWDGRIDDPRIYNRVLTGAEFKILYNQGFADLEAISTIAIPTEIGGATHTASATLSGSATLTALPEHQQAASSALSATSSLSAIATHEQAAQATLTGAGTLTATATLISAAAATALLSGVGTLSAVGTLEIAAATVLSGSSSLVGIGTHEQAASAIVSGVATIQATATVERGASSTLSGTGTLTATATLISAGATALLQGQGTLTASPSLEISGTSVLTGSSSLVASPLVEFAGNAVLAGVGTLVANGSIVAPTNQTALLAGTSSLVARVSTHLGPLIATVSVSPSLVFDTQTEPSIIAKTEVNPNG
jgi:hypothetical protein